MSEKQIEKTSVKLIFMLRKAYIRQENKIIIIRADPCLPNISKVGNIDTSTSLLVGKNIDSEEIVLIPMKRVIWCTWKLNSSETQIFLFDERNENLLKEYELRTRN